MTFFDHNNYTRDDATECCRRKRTREEGGSDGMKATPDLKT